MTIKYIRANKYINISINDRLDEKKSLDIKFGFGWILDRLSRPIRHTERLDRPNRPAQNELDKTRFD